MIIMRKIFLQISAVAQRKMIKKNDCKVLLVMTSADEMRVKNSSKFKRALISSQLWLIRRKRGKR